MINGFYFDKISRDLDQYNKKQSQFKRRLHFKHASQEIQAEKYKQRIERFLYEVF